MNCSTCGKKQTTRIERGKKITFPCRDYVAHRNAEVSALIARGHSHAFVLRDGVQISPEKLDIRNGNYGPICYQIH